MSVRESAHTHSCGSSAGGVASAAAASPPPPPRPAPVTLASERGISVSVSGTMRGLTSASRLSSAIGEWQTLERKEGREAQAEQHAREPKVDGRAHHRRPVHLGAVRFIAVRSAGLRGWPRVHCRVREERAGDHRLRKACQRDAGDSDCEERRPRPPQEGGELLGGQRERRGGESEDDEEDAQLQRQPADDARPRRAEVLHL
eukprot:scaffold75798_cov63-Phaeocystis_antarctica.AAC.5